MSKIKIFALGGLNENGKNMYIVNVDKDIFVFDAGLKYDNDIKLGIDYIIPNFDYLIKNKKNIKGIFLTHGHESNMGAIPDILEQIPNVPVYGTIHHTRNLPVSAHQGHNKDRNLTQFLCVVFVFLLVHP